MGDLRNAHIGFFQVSLGLADPMNIGILADGIARNLFENPADIRLA